MGFGFVGDMVDDLRVINPEYPQDSLGLLPFVGAPFAYNTFRSGRGTWGATALGAAIGIGVGEFAFWYAGSRAGFTASEWAVGRGLSALGVRYGGRSYLGYAFFGARSTAGFGWGVPPWAIALGLYELYGVTDRALKAYDEAGAPNVYFDHDWSVEHF